MKLPSSVFCVLLVSAALALSPILVACGDDGDGGGGGGTTQVFDSSQANKDKMLSELSQEEVTALCEEYQEYVASEISEAELKRFACYAVAAAFSGGDANACNMIAQECINAPAEENNSGLEPDDSSDDCNPDDVKDCDATVGELEACFSATIDQLNSAAQNASCSTSSLDDVGSPAACAPLMEKCPELFEDDGNNGFNNNTSSSDATLSIDGASVTVVDTSFSAGGGNGNVILTLADGSLSFTWSVPSLPAEINMAEAMETENATVTLTQGGATFTNTTSDTTPGTLTVMESPSGFGVVLQFTGTVVDGDGNEKTLDATYE